MQTTKSLHGNQLYDHRVSTTDFKVLDQSDLELSELVPSSSMADPWLSQSSVWLSHVCPKVGYGCFIAASEFLLLVENVSDQLQRLIFMNYYPSLSLLQTRLEAEGSRGSVTS